MTINESMLLLVTLELIDNEMMISVRTDEGYGLLIRVLSLLIDGETLLSVGSIEFIGVESMKLVVDSV